MVSIPAVDYGYPLVNSGSVPPPAASRPYRSPVRAERAARTRAAILSAATASFLHDGYAGTTMRSVARAAGVSVPTVELAFGTKAALLKAAIDVAIAGDDDPVAVLDRPWAGEARALADPRDVLGLAARVLAAAQARSAGLMLALFEGAAGGDELDALRRQMVAQREVTAAWLVDRLAERSALRHRLRRAEAVDMVWALIDPALFDRLTRHRGWTAARYERWIADTLAAALLAPAGPRSTPAGPRSAPVAARPRSQPRSPSPRSPARSTRKKAP